MESDLDKFVSVALQRDKIAIGPNVATFVGNSENRYKSDYWIVKSPVDGSWISVTQYNKDFGSGGLFNYYIDSQSGISYFWNNNIDYDVLYRTNMDYKTKIDMMIGFSPPKSNSKDSTLDNRLFDENNKIIDSRSENNSKGSWNAALDRLKPMSPVVSPVVRYHRKKSIKKINYKTNKNIVGGG